MTIGFSKNRFNSNFISEDPQTKNDHKIINCRELITKKLNKFNDNKINCISLFFIKIIMFFLKSSSSTYLSFKANVEKHEYSILMSKYCNKFLKRKDYFTDFSPAQFKAVNSIFSQERPEPESVHQLYVSLKYLRLLEQLKRFNQTLTQKPKRAASAFSNLPKQLKNDLTKIICTELNLSSSYQNVENELQVNPDLIFKISNNYNKSILDQLLKFYEILEFHYIDIFVLKDLMEKGESNDNPLIIPQLSKHSRTVIQELIDKDQHTLVQWISGLEEEISNLVLKFASYSKEESDATIYSATLNIKKPHKIAVPLNIALVSVEYATLVSQGGLAEAVQGLAQGLLKTNPGNKVQLIFPKYNTLPISIQLKKSEVQFFNGNKELINVYKADLDGVECYFIEDSNFNLDAKDPSIYKGKEKERFAAFMSLAADVLYQIKDIDVIHLHDWHVAGVALKLAKEHPEEWRNGIIPPTVFTFHNNNRSAQGRNMAGIYNYDPVIKAFEESGIIEQNGNLFVETLNVVDAVTTVSETFAKESQMDELGEGVSFAVRAAAKVGKLTGIVNGINTMRWNPETDINLKNWKDPVTQEVIDLRFAPTSDSIASQKSKAKQQVSKWIQPFINRDTKEKYSALYSQINDENDLERVFHAKENEDLLFIKKDESGNIFDVKLKAGIEQWDVHDKKFQDLALKITKDFDEAKINKWIFESSCLELEKKLIIRARKYAISSRSDLDWNGRPLILDADKSQKLSEIEIFDPNKPMVIYVGRFDSYQKGLDKLEEAINATLDGGGQFVLMGSQEDELATKILDELEYKYCQKVLFLRDFKDSKGKFFYQQGNPDEDRPGIGSVVRAAADFVYLPSRYEPCGLVQFESWLFGALTIGSNTGGIADTVISPEKNFKEYNGYLFDRASTSLSGAYETIKRALNDWNNLDIPSKDQIHKRIITSGRKYSWSDSPKGYTPVQKYHAIYQNAINEAKNSTRKVIRTDGKFDLRQILKRSLGEHKADKAQQSLEERYLEAYYYGNLSDRELDALYSPMHFGLKSQLPMPYGRIESQNYNRYGAKVEGNTTSFRLLAPKTSSVTVKLFDQDENFIKAVPLKRNAATGDWETTIEECSPGTSYQYDINGQTKIDPYALSQRFSKCVQKAPYSVVCLRDSFNWTDGDWLKKRENEAGSSRPMSIYEIHPTSWKRDDKGQPLNYKVLAKELVEHCRKGKFTHIELMGILEHPCEASMGYQVTGYFAPNSRMGSLDDFKFLVNHLHENGIHVILDWIPGHFAEDKYGLAQFDSSALYETEAWFSKRYLYGWGKYSDFSKKEVREFLISSAMYWVKELHIDGLRVDAVKNILHCEDKSAAELFLKELNTIIHTNTKGAITIAEDYSKNISNTTISPMHGGLGFDYKWNIGWLKTIDNYFKKPINERNNQVLIDSFDDVFHKMILAISHDQVKDQKTTIRGELKNNVDKALANERALFSFMFCSPGKKLNFMGNEGGNLKEWKSYLGHDKGMMNLEKQDNHLLNMFAKLNELYITEKTLWEKDNNGSDVEWVSKGDLLAYRRTSSDNESVICFHNFKSNQPIEYKVKVNGLNSDALPILLFNSEAEEFGGKEELTFKLLQKDGKCVGYKVIVPSLGTAVIKEK